LVVMTLLSVIQANIPVGLFAIEHLAPGIAVFGLSFISLISGMLIARDRSSSFLMRLLASPMTAADYIAGYALPMLPVAVLQSLVCLLAAMAWGLPLSWTMISCLLSLLPAAVLFIGIGMICGSVFTDRQVGGVCGALLTNVSAWLSGTWFDISLLGGGFEAFARVLPFANAVDAARAALNGQWSALPKPLLIVCAWATVSVVCAILLFRRSMKRS
ncbi:MAG: ABC transporter permease, partial [Clostridia bacterium]|nr:ABC transporter permease [Clostridia bacterium]